MGDMNIAKEMIKIAAIYCKADVAKFQTRNNRELLTELEYNAPHPNPIHSYGETYGLHREALEFTIEQHQELMEYCKSFDIIYCTSVWDMSSAKGIAALEPSMIKIPSAMNNHFEMLSWLCENFNGELHVSTGMTNYEEIEKLVSFFISKNRNKDLILYNCTSGYPVPYKDVRLLEIKRLIELYKDVVGNIGFSGHHIGSAIDIAAYTLGAEWIERHFTLDRTLKGTDHSASLEPHELKLLVENLNNTSDALAYKQEEILGIEIVQRGKLKYKG